MHRMLTISPSVSFKSFISSRFPGIVLALILSAAASKLGSLVPIVGPAVFAIILGILFRVCIGYSGSLERGTAFASKKILQFGIVLLGAGLNIHTLFVVGKQSFVVMIGTLLIALLGGHLIGQWMGLPHRLTSLISAGTGICGASAISSLSPIIEAEEGEVAFSISTIFLFNVLAVLLFPMLGRLFHFTDSSFGLWAGTAINDTSSVVAAGYSFSKQAGDYATVVKLTRSLMIIPVCLMYLLGRAISSKRQLRGKKSVKLPLFILGFVGMSIVRTLGWFGPHGGEYISQAGQYCIVVALAAVGLSADLRAMRRTGWRPIVLGLAVWILVAGSSLLLQKAAGL